jgi:hypothetical protein
VNRSPGASKARHFVGVIIESRFTAVMVDEMMGAEGTSE